MKGDDLRRAWDRVWFSPEPALSLVAARWLVFGTLAIDVWYRRGTYRAIPDLPAALWDPISLLGVIPLPPPTATVVTALLWIVWVGVVATLCRVVPRITGPLAAVAGTILILMDNSYGKIDHDQQLLVIMAVVLAFAAVPRLRDAASWRFRWPVQLCRAAFGMMLLAAAISKLRASGLDWVFSPNLRNILVAENLLLRDPALRDLALWIAGEPFLWQSAAAATILGEAALIVAVFVRRPIVRVPAIAAGIATVVGVTLLVGLIGPPIVTLAAIFVAVDRLVHAERGDVPLRPRLVHAERGDVPLSPRLILPAAGVLILSVTLLIHPTPRLSAIERPILAIPLIAFAAVVAVGLLRERRIGSAG